MFALVDAILDSPEKSVFSSLSTFSRRDRHIWISDLDIACQNIATTYIDIKNCKTSILDV